MKKTEPKKDKVKLIKGVLPLQPCCPKKQEHSFPSAKGLSEIKQKYRYQNDGMGLGFFDKWDAMFAEIQDIIEKKDARIKELEEQLKGCLNCPDLITHMDFEGELIKKDREIAELKAKIVELEKGQ